MKAMARMGCVAAIYEKGATTMQVPRHADGKQHPPAIDQVAEDMAQLREPRSRLRITEVSLGAFFAALLKGSEAFYREF